jgi:hypothetical protein
MKKLLILGLCVSLTACGTTGMQGNPGAIMVGAQVGNMVGSIIGNNSNDYAGWAISTIAGTIAGAAIGNAISTPKNNVQQQQQSGYTVQDNSYPEPANGNYSNGNYNNGNYSNNNYQNSAVLPVAIQNIRFVDDNNNHAIGSGEFCKLIFELYNNSNKTVYGIYPEIQLSSKRVGVSAPALVDKILPGQKVRYTASVYGYSNLRDGSVDFTMTIRQQNTDYTGDQRQFTLNTQR